MYYIQKYQHNLLINHSLMLWGIHPSNIPGNVALFDLKGNRINLLKIAVKQREALRPTGEVGNAKLSNLINGKEIIPIDHDSH